jgi:hypothetical protein
MGSRDAIIRGNQRQPLNRAMTVVCIISLSAILGAAAGGIRDADLADRVGTARPSGPDDIRAVHVHGSGVERPFIIHDPPAAPPCIWSFTYNVRAGDRFEPPPSDAKVVVLSFITEEEWTSLVVEGGVNPERLEPTHARKYHTRIVLGPAGAPVYAQHRRAPWPGPFRGGYTLSELGEDYLGSFGIPTHVDGDGAPSFVQLDNADRERLRAEYRAPDGVCDARESWGTRRIGPR